METRLLLADDHTIMRQGLKALIEKEAHLCVVAEAGNGAQTVALARRAAPHVVIMDVAMPDLNGIEATRRILRENPNTKVVALSGHANKRFVREMLKAGASAYVLKKRAYEDLVRAIRAVLEGKKYLSPAIARGVIDDYVELSSASVPDDPAFVGLTDREREVLQQVAEGRTTKQIAAALKVSVKTVETHRRNMMAKLNLHSVAELTKYAIREGVTSVDV
ncbi:MAG: response regulator transcription factor [Kiritimatiellae bacterium]|nr:response regulator transcription factor [Kiritimatiellia bacterium]